ncbi:MAG TPA: Gfo/Idh/MocA family oxidoreductase [Devosia sp.]|nr:Gfo/Idh/MocA family oxidoreductase [Devosia sp.]
MTTVRWGILAPSKIAQKFVADLKLVKGAEIVAVGSRDKSRAEDFAKQFDIPKAYGSYLELVSDPKIDIVYISSIHPNHYAHSMMALEHGKGVLVEKPFAMNAREASEMVALARKKKLFLMEALWSRCHPAAVAMRQRIRDGAIGDIRVINASLGPIGSAPDRRSQQPELGGGVLLECGVYPLHFAQYMAPDLDDTSEVSAWSTIDDRNVDQATSMAIRTKSGIAAMLSASFGMGFASGLQSRAYVSGSTGWINVPRDIFWPKEFTLYRAGADPENFVSEAIGYGYTHEAEEVVRCLNEGLIESPYVTHEDSLTVMRLLDRIRGKIGLVYPADKQSSAA